MISRSLAITCLLKWSMMQISLKDAAAVSRFGEVYPGRARAMASEIRYARREDVRAIEAIFRSYEPDHDWAYARKYYEDFFGSPEHHRDDAVLVAVSESRVVGVI